MNQTSHSMHWTLVGLALTISFLFFALGEFELLEILNLKRPVQALLIGTLAIFTVLIRLENGVHAALLDPLFLTAMTFLAFEVLVHDSRTRKIEMVITAVLLTYVFCMGPRFAALVLKFIITGAGVFACMALLEFLILVLFPQLMAGTVSSTMNAGGGDDWNVLSPLAYLGMTTGELKRVAGVSLPRMSSFLREPSLIPPVFLLPAALALTFKSRVRLWAIPILAFAISGFAGSVYAPVAIGLVFMVVMSLPIIRRRPALLASVAFAVVIAMLILIYRTTYIDDALRFIFTHIGRQSSLSFLDKWGSANIRIYAGRDFVASGFEGGFDRPNIAIGAIGLILFAYARAGIVSAMFMSWHLLRTFHASFRYRVYARGSKIASALIVGVFVQAGFLNTYGFWNSAGFLIMALTVVRLRSLTPEHSPVRSRAPLRNARRIRRLRRLTAYAP